MSDAKSGSLDPPSATKESLKVGREHLHTSLVITLIKSFYGGLLLSAGGLLSLSIAGGSANLAPGIERLLQGLLFPVGLVIIYFVGAELYTGYPMWFALTALEGEGNVWLYVSRLTASWIGDLGGALTFAYFFTYLTQSLAEEPFKSGVIELVTKDIVETEWHVIFLKAIPCGFLVSVAMFMGSQNHDGISKALGLHLPFFLSVAARYPHTVEYMYLCAVGILMGAPLTWGAYFWKCLLPITIGNTLGGAILTGAYSWFIFIKCEGQSESDGIDVDGLLRL